jgi:hypothetical protein
LVHPGCNDDTLRNARQERFDFLGYSFGPHHYKANGYYDLPVVGTLRQCINTETGWRVVDEAGAVVEVSSWAQAHGLTASPATIPAGNRIVKVENGRLVGVFVLKPKRRLA